MTVQEKFEKYWDSYKFSVAHYKTQNKPARDKTVSNDSYLAAAKEAREETIYECVNIFDNSSDHNATRKAILALLETL